MERRDHGGQDVGGGVKLACAFSRSGISSGASESDRAFSSSTEVGNRIL